MHLRNRKLPTFEHTAVFHGRWQYLGTKFSTCLRGTKFSMRVTSKFILLYTWLKQNYSCRSRDVVIAPAQPDHRKSKFGLRQTIKLIGAYSCMFKGHSLLFILDSYISLKYTVD